MRIQFSNYSCIKPMQQNNQKRSSNVNFNAKGVFAGTFDPPTYGHKYLVEKAANLFPDGLYVVVGINPDKTPRISVEDRLMLLRQITKGLNNVIVDYNEGKTVDYAKEHGAEYLLRGMRPNVLDFKYEVSVHDENEKKAPEIQTVYILSNSINQAVSSSVIRKLIDEGKFDDIKELVPDPVYKYIIEKYKK